MTIPDDLAKKLLELLDKNHDYLYSYEEEVRANGDWLVYSQEEIKKHRHELWELKHQIEEQASE